MRTRRILALSFLSAALAGALLLSLPQATVGDRLPFVDALFTATSAVCVTGLTVVDTGSRFTVLGQTVIALLIQVGGLGIMTLSTMLLLSIGQKLTFRSRSLIVTGLGQGDEPALRAFVGRVAAVTVGCELAGAIVLALLLVARHGEPLHQAIGHGLFLSVSAFCNAGFAPWPDSLARFAHDGFLLGAVMVLIVTGGVGFVVLADLSDRMRDRSELERRQLTLHSRLVLATTGMLLLLGTVVFAALEWRSGLAGMSTGERILACVFQSVTTRTAGFSIIDGFAWTMPSIFIMMLLMLIGAAPGSTGGGLKVTTIAVLWATARARYQGRQTVQLFNRSLPEATVSRALASAAVGVAATVIFVLALLIADPLRGADQVAGFVVQAFETVSALGTVGLSLGATSQLTTAGRWIIIVAMFVGRLGPLTMALAVSKLPQPSRVKLAEEDVMVG